MNNLFIAITSKTLRLAGAAFALGLISGVAGAVLFSINLVDQLYLDRETLQSELSEAQSRINMLEQSLTERRTRVVRSVAVRLDTGDQHLTLKLANHARQLVDGLIGQEVASIDPGLVAAIFHKRIVRVDQGQFELNLDYLIISDTVTVSLTAQKASEGASNENGAM